MGRDSLSTLSVQDRVHRVHKVKSTDSVQGYLKGWVESGIMRLNMPFSKGNKLSPGRMPLKREYDFYKELDRVAIPKALAKLMSFIDETDKGMATLSDYERAKVIGDACKVIMSKTPERTRVVDADGNDRLTSVNLILSAETSAIRQRYEEELRKQLIRPSEPQL